MAFARAGCCRLSRCGERWTWWGLPIATSFFLPVERNLPIHLRRGPGQDPVDNEPGDLGPMGSKGNSCYLLGGAGDKDDPSPP